MVPFLLGVYVSFLLSSFLVSPIRAGAPPGASASLSFAFPPVGDLCKPWSHFTRQAEVGFAVRKACFVEQVIQMG